MRLEEKIVNDSVGLEETLRLMNLIFLENLKNNFFCGWAFAQFGSPENAYDLYQQVWEYVVKNFEYEDDPIDEKLTAPKYLIEIRKGDCDDFALFIKTVLGIYGRRSHFLLLGKTPEGYTHVAVITQEGIIIDGTNDKFNSISEDYKYRRII